MEIRITGLVIILLVTTWLLYRLTVALKEKK